MVSLDHMALMSGSRCVRKRFTCTLQAKAKPFVPPPKTLKDLDARLNEKGIELIDFYLAKKDLQPA